MVEIFGISVPERELLYWIIGIVVFAIAVALVYVFYLRSKMKTAKIATTAGSYIRDNSFQLDRCSDFFLYANVTKVRINNDKRN